jgi:hypothetical protein
MSHKNNDAFFEWLKSILQSDTAPGDAPDWASFEQFRKTRRRKTLLRWSLTGVPLILLGAALMVFSPFKKPTVTPHSDAQNAQPTSIFHETNEVVKVSRNADEETIGTPDLFDASLNAQNATESNLAIESAYAEMAVKVAVKISSQSVEKNLAATNRATVPTYSATIPSQVDTPSPSRQLAGEATFTTETAAESTAVISTQIPQNEEIFAVKQSNLDSTETNHASQAAINFSPIPDPKWSFIVSIYPSFTFRELGINPGRAQSVHQNYEDIANTSERHGFAMNTGLDISYNFSQDLFITSGLYYIQHKIGGRYNFENELRPILNLGIIQGYETVPAIVVDRSIFNTYHYLNVPLLLSYQPWASPKIRIKMEGGISTLFFVGAEGITLDPTSLAIRESADLDYRSILFSLNIRIGASYLLNKNVMFGLEPSLLYFNNTIYKDPEHPVYMVPYAVGLNANIRILLN